MTWFWYNILFGIVFVLLLPRFISRMLKRGGYGHAFLNRFGCYDKTILENLRGPRRIWIHAVSVGEMGVCLQAVNEWKHQDPEARFIVSVTTSTGYKIAADALSADDVLIYFPVDFPIVLRKVLRLLQPKMLIIVETELWPNVIRMLHHRSIPVVMLNGRISDRSYPRYRKVRCFTRRLLPLIDMFLMQSEESARRIIDLGAVPENVKVLPSMKYDQLHHDPVGDEAAVASLRQVGIQEGHRMLLGASTWPGEEKLLATHFIELRKQHNDLKLVLVPRHAERRQEVLNDVQALGLTVQLKSRLGTEVSDPDVLVVDTTGDLRNLYAHAALVFTGKTLCAQGGQNMIEPAYEGRAIVVGPHVQNFRETVDDLRAAEGICMVQDVEGLARALADLLTRPDELARLGKAAQAVIEAKTGSTQRAVTTLRELIEAT